MNDIVQGPGLTAIMIGANDLAGTMGQMGNPKHPDVQSAIETVVAAAHDAGVFPGIGMADDPAGLLHWMDKGIQWVLMGVDWAHLARAIEPSADRLGQSMGNRELGDSSRRNSRCDV